ncbi:unnamed protein product [Rangifer tarandus platyrhynchus]|uniref:Uncharacterized protein n=1 Tax=Rangifer tarandus platyrhynchus TaxID=3082113 RepID=A0AC60A986_RANTA
MLSPGGVSPPPTGNPDAKERLDKPTPTPAPRGGERARRTKRPYPTLTVRTHTPHTPPGREGERPRGPGLSAARAARTKEGIPELCPRGGGVLLKPDSHPRQDPRRNGNNEKPPSPAIPAPRAAGGGGAISAHTPADTHTRPPSAPAPARPSAARSPAELSHGRARRARAPSPPRASLASPAPAPTRGSAGRVRSETRAQAAGAAAQYGEPRLPQWSSGNTTGAAQYS